jgi:DNA modification methylase
MSKFISGTALYKPDSIESIPSSTFDLILFYHDVKNSPVKEDRYADWLFKESKKLMRTLKSTGSMITMVKKSTTKGKRDTHSIDYLRKMSDNEYWTETFIWHKTNPTPTGNKKRLKNGFEDCYHFTRSKDYRFFPEQCLIKAKNEWGEGSNTSFLTRSSNVVSTPVVKGQTPVSLSEFFIKLMTDKDGVVLIPHSLTGNEVIACLSTGRDHLSLSPDEIVLNRVGKRALEWSDVNFNATQTVFD